MLGNALKSARRALRLTQAMLAHRASLSIPTVRLLERGSGNLHSFSKVLEALGVKLWAKNLPPAKTLGGRIAALRKRRGLSQRALAVRIGTSQPTLIRLEREGRGRVRLLGLLLSHLGAGEAVFSAQAPGFYRHAGNSSGGHSWQTPAWLLDVLKKVFGVFDLDPCSPTIRRRGAPVSAKVYFTEEDDGLSLPWHGKVFVNPPYGRELKRWTAKARAEYLAGKASLVIALVPARTDTTWWHRDVLGEATIMFLKGRLRFGENAESAPFPSALVIWGARPARVRALQGAIPGAWVVHAPKSGATEKDLQPASRSGRRGSRKAKSAS